MLRNFIAALLGTLLFCACQEQKKELPSSVNGTWESIGSGWILQVQDSAQYQFYDITSVSCLPSRKGAFAELRPSLRLQGDTLDWNKGVITYQFTRSKELPALCRDSSDDKNNDPLYNFEVFAQTVKEHYAFFELNQINWEKLYQQQKQRLTRESTDADLYQVLEETLEQLNDNHAFLEATDEVYEEIEQQSKQEEPTTSEQLPEYGDFQVAQMVAEHHLQEELTRDSWLIQWGKMTENIGFIQVKSMWLYADLDIPEAVIQEKGYVDAYVETFHKMYEGEYIQKEVEGVASIMDRVMADLSDMERIVIDVRFNGGGQDAVSFEILSRFATQSKQVATQKLRYGQQYTPVLPLFIQGREDAFEKTVYVLTSPQTGSAAEAFSISTLAMDNVKRIGSATSGAMSTALEKTLPNGWSFSISNEIYMDNDGQSYENIGIPVDYELRYPRERQPFFRGVVNDLEADKRNILTAIDSLSTR
ncbi:MAG: S41 family peptidase [Bacteroidota bacterium]